MLHAYSQSVSTIWYDVDSLTGRSTHDQPILTTPCSIRIVCTPLLFSGLISGVSYFLVDLSIYLLISTRPFMH